MVGELMNKRRAVGYLGEVQAPREFNNKYYTDFTVRYVKAGNYYRVIDYPFGGNQTIIDQLQMIEPNSLVIVTFEIRSKPNKNIAGMWNISLGATSVFEYGEQAKEWIWKVQDFMTRAEASEIRKQLPGDPQVDEILREPPEDAKQRQRSPVNTGYSIKGAVEAKKPFKSELKNEPAKETDLPF